MNAEARKLVARDRVLLYTRGMDIDPETGVALALESLHRAGADAGPDKVMGELFHILREKYHSRIMADDGKHPLASAPPLNRRAMVAKDMESFSFFGGLRARFRSLTALFNRPPGDGA